MSPESPARQRTYAGWQQEKVAALYGLSAPRAAMLSAAALSVIAPLGILGLRSGLVLWPAAIVLAVSALVRVNGRTGDEWLAGLVSYLLIRGQGQHKFAAGPFRAHGQPATVTGEVIRDEETAADEAAGLELPGILAPLRLLSVPAAGRDLAVVEHRYDRTYTAVARVRVPGIGLSDSARRDQRVAGWGSLLASLCTEGGPVTRVQVVQRLVPESGAALRSWHQAHLTPDAPALAARVAADLLATSTLTTSRREAYLAITMDSRRAATQVRAAGGGDLGAAAVLVRLLRGLQQPLGSADLEVEDWLGTRDLAEVIRTAYDPAAQPLLAARRAGAATGGMPAGTAPGLAGPVYAESRPGAYVHDGAVSVSYWVHSWPRSQAYCTALGPLLADGSHRRSFAMIYEPLGPRQAERAVMRERTARHVAVRMRQRTGQLVPEHERTAMDRALHQDAERAAGHGLARFTGYLTVTATPETVEDACAALEADAAAARIEVRRMWFAQDSGFALGALPLGLGLPKRGW
jgi:Putative type VII ESX secretion system translocon, EccE